MLWSYALAAVGIFGIWLAGRRNLWGWAVGCVAQVLWIVYAIVTDQYGFIVSAVAYGAVYGKNWRRWHLEHRAVAKSAAVAATANVAASDSKIWSNGDDDRPS